MSIKVYEVINDRIMEQLEQGTIPWHRTWNSESNMSKNLVSRKENGGNRAFYSPAQDIVQLPNQHTFQSPEESYST